VMTSNSEVSDAGSVNDGCTTKIRTLTVRKTMKVLHTSFGVLIFFILFLFFFPPLMIPVIFPAAFKLTGIFNRWCARILLIFIGIPFKVEYKKKLAGSGQYIFCPNHFSFLDIPTMGLNHHNSIFVGKSDMEKIPMFGFMYSRLHITVDRSKLKSRYTSLMRSRSAIDEGKSLIIFPEGGIVTEHDPVMGNFKDGAFRISIEKQIPIVPVTIPYNWIILPADEFVLTWKPIKVIFHEPVDPAKYSLDDIQEYKEEVRRIIDNELKQHNEH
jgi:1-acyl-sn-glycerol-3-phosphate acyltransferase